MLLKPPLIDCLLKLQVAPLCTLCPDCKTSHASVRPVLTRHSDQSHTCESVKLHGFVYTSAVPSFVHARLPGLRPGT